MVKKKVYESPSINSARVELESAICAGSVEFKGSDLDKSVSIEGQGVVEASTTNNDFSNEGWTFDNASSTTDQ